MTEENAADPASARSEDLDALLDTGEGAPRVLRVPPLLAGAVAFGLVVVGAVGGILMQRHLHTGIDWAHFGSVISNFGPAATTLAAGSALLVGVLAWSQKRHADASDQFWKRLQWILDRSDRNDNSTATLGMEMLVAVAKEPHAQKREGGIIKAATKRLLLQIAPAEMGVAEEEAEFELEDPEASGSGEGGGAK